jgi:hypothetical protein
MKLIIKRSLDSSKVFVSWFNDWTSTIFAEDAGEWPAKAGVEDALFQHDNVSTPFSTRFNTTTPTTILVLF